MIRIDFHAHSKKSGDALNTAEELAAEAKRKGLDGIGICDHNVLARQRLKTKGVLVLFGEEVSTRQGHVAVFGVEKAFPRGIDAFELVERVRAQGGVTIATHPFALFRSSVGSLALKLKADAIEKYNGSSVLGNVVAMARLRNGTGGSDAHAASELGTAFTLFDCEPKESEVLECIRKGRFKGAWNPDPLRPFKRLWMRARG